MSHETRNYELIDRVRELEHERRQAFRYRNQTCRRGHPKTPENTIRRADGALECQICRRMRSRK